MAESSVEAGWDVCGAPGCRGARVSPDGECLAHASAQALQEGLGQGDQPVDLDGRGCRFDGRALDRLLGAIPVAAGHRRLGVVRFDGATFTAPAAFDGTTFAGPASFAGVTFAREARFGDATFEGDVSFASATFAGPGWFVGCNFRGRAGFWASTFSELALFQRTTFGADATFDGVSFVKNVTFASAVFSSVASFSDVVFGGRAVFDQTTFAHEPAEPLRSLLSEQAGDLAAAALPGVGGAPAVGPPVWADDKPPGRRVRARRRWRAGRRRLMSMAVPLAGLVLLAGVAYVVLRPEGTTKAPASLDEVAPSGQEQEGGDPTARGRPDAFALSSDANGLPIRFDPCRPIRYVVNAKDAPEDWQASVVAALDEVASATGLRFQDAGATDEVVPLPTLNGRTGPGVGAPTRREPYQPGRYGTTDWAPVLIYFTDLAEAVGRGTDGLSRTDIRPNPDGKPVRVSGTIIVSNHMRPTYVKAVLMHELAHLVGLSHVADPLQIMAAAHVAPATRWGAGDLNGLMRVGQSMGCLKNPTPG